MVGALAAGLIAAAVAGCLPPPARSAMEMKSPAGVGAAASVLSHDWDGSFASFYVLDPKVNRGRPIHIATLSANIDFDDMEWSRDGTMVVIAKGGQLAYGYDFGRHQAINVPGKVTNVDQRTTVVAAATPSERDQFIHQALERHGGRGMAARANSRRGLSSRESSRYGR